MNKPEFYPYVLLPEEIEKIKIEGIPVPEIKELPDFPEKPKKRFLGTIILVVSVAVILLINLTKVLKGHYSIANGITFFAFFIAIVSLTAMVFEILQNSKAKKQYRIAIKLYEELEAERKQLQQKRIQAVDDNNNPKAIEAYRHDTINKYFKYSYNKIQAVQHEQTAVHKRFMIFLEQYFEGKILENVRIVHEPKNLDYSPGFLLKLDNPKVNIAIDIEEPYQFDGKRVVVKKNKAEELYKIRNRVTNELRWVSIVFSEEQIVSHPTESCKLIANTIDEIILKEKYVPKFKGVEKLKRVEIPGQRELSAQIRSKHREKYLAAAGLTDDLTFVTLENDKKNLDKKTIVLEKDEKQSEKIKLEDKEIKKTEKVEVEKTKIEKTEKTKVVDLKKDITKKTEDKKLAEEKTPVKNKENQESDIEQVEQLQIVKKVTDRLRSEKQSSGQKTEKKLVQKKSDEDSGKTIVAQNKQKKKVDDHKEKVVKEKTTEHKKEEKTIKTDLKKGQLKREAELLNKLYESEIDTKAKVDNKKKEETTEKKKETTEKKIEQPVSKEKELQKRMQMEKERLEKKKLEQEKLLKERKAKELLAQEALEKKKAEQLLIEKELMNKEKRENERKEKVRLEIERLAQERKSKAKDEKERLAKELLAKKKIEQERVEKERIEKENADKKRAEEEKLVKAQEEKKRIEQERIAKEKAEKDLADKKRKVKEQENAARLEKEKQDKIKQEKEKLQIEKLQKELDKKAEIEAKNKILEQQKAEIEVLVIKKDWDKLNIKCNELIKKYPYWDWPYYRRSTVNGNKGKFKEVLVDCNKALGINPSFADAYYNRATAKFFLENYAEAVEDYQKCIDFDYKNKMDALFNKGLCYKNLNYPKKAYGEFLKAKDLGSNKAEEIIKQEYS
jgi:hypothetical protein